MDCDCCCFLLHSTLCLVAANPPLYMLCGAYPCLRGCVKIWLPRHNLLEEICSSSESFSLCPANCHAGNLGFSPSSLSFSYKLQLSLRDFEDRRKDDDDDGDGGDAQVVTAVGGGDGGNGRRFGRKEGKEGDGETVAVEESNVGSPVGSSRRSVGPWENPLQLYPACNSHNAPSSKQLRLSNLRT